MGVPATTDLSAARAAVLGMPFDCGTHPFRVGSRQGPAAIREQSRLIRRYNPESADFDPAVRLGLVDCGDVRLVPGRIEEAFAAMEAATARLVDAGVAPITMGGDGAVTLPQLRALRRRHPDLVALHIDSHTDAYAYSNEEKYNNATQFTHAAGEGLIDAPRSFHIGVRGPASVGGIVGRARGLGYGVVTLRELVRRGTPDVLAEIHAAMRGRPVYLCWDMDVFDPSVAPGVATPVWGGLTAREGIALMQGFAGLRIVAVDVNTVSPPHDHGGMTAFLAAHMLYEGLVLLCRALGLDAAEAG
ncbi:MAG: arginase family protein [Alphaproteobacteria bacterium]|nr:arginase family protein [Alphaproteobacteria bacterium]